MLKGLFSRKRTGTRSGPAVSYEEQKQHLRSTEADVRRDLAARDDTRPEILYYLATDSAPEVRQAIAANEATPVQADEVLAQDDSAEVRCELADKIARLVPDMPADEQENVRVLTLEVLERLASDDLPRVRAVVSERLKSADNVPRHVIEKLALDLEAAVATPVLQFSPILTDADLLKIIEVTQAEGAHTAIASRSSVSDRVSDAIAASEDPAAIAALLANGNAIIREETLDRIIDAAPGQTSWHEPLVHRPSLSTQAVLRIADFVAASLVKALADRNNLDPDTTARLEGIMRDGHADDDEAGEEAQIDRARELHARGELDEEAVMAAIENGERRFVAEAMSLMSGLERPIVLKLLNSGDGKAVTSVAWKSGLAMRTALQLQSRIAKVPPPKMLNARNGTDYPLSPKDMEWQIGLVS